MKERLRNAYDQMKMPDDCARRIERAMKEKAQGTDGRYTMKAAAPRRGGWKAAAALACLVVAVSVGGSFLLRDRGTQPQFSADPDPQSAVTTGQLAVEETGEDPAATVEFLDYGICFSYPDHWKEENQQNEDGGVNAFYDQDLGMTVFSLERSEAWLVDLSLEEAEYQDQISQQYTSGVLLELSKTTVGGMDANKLTFAYEESGESRMATRYDVVANQVGYRFTYYHPQQGSASLDQEVEALMATVQFEGQPEETTDQTQAALEDGPQDVAKVFAAAYFAGDPEAMQLFLSQDFDQLLEGYPMDGTKVNIQQLRGLENDTQETEGYIGVVFLESEEADSFTTLSLDMVKEGDEWKIRYYGLEK